MATCPKCGVNERLPSKAYCHECLKAYKRNYNKDYYVKNKDYLAEYYKERYDANPVVHRARALANKAHPIPQPCSKCGSTEYPERHHPDYSKPTDIVWLCRSCHKELEK